MMNRKNLLRWGGAAIAAICATLIGATSGAYADEPCGLKQAQSFQLAITNPQQEADPAYYLSTAETFIQQCPTRFEVRDAHLIAARGALDSGKAKRAVHHYDSAQAMGVQLTPAQSMDYSVALLALGADGRAVAVRRSAIATWAARLTQTGLGELDIRSVKGGTIYSARFDAIDPNRKISALWIAEPTGPGFPAAVVLTHAPQRAAWQALRKGKTVAGPLMTADLHQCRKQETILESALPLLAADVEISAQQALAAYLKSPDKLAPTVIGTPLPSCVTLPVMLHVPDPVTAVYPSQ